MLKLKRKITLHAEYCFIQIHNLATNIDLLYWHDPMDGIRVYRSKYLYVYLYEYHDPLKPFKKSPLEHQTVAFWCSNNKEYRVIAYGKLQKLFNGDIPILEFLSGDKSLRK